MDIDAQTVISDVLDSGERFIWAGIPQQGFMLKSSDIFMIPFSLLWGGFAIYWEYMALTITPDANNGTGADIVFPLFGIPFVLIGLYMIFGRFIHESKKRTKTFYGLTDRRAIIISGLFRKNVKSLNIRSLSDISLSESSNGRGTIIFGQENSLNSIFMGGGFPGMTNETPRFEQISDAKMVFKSLQEQQYN
jgi:hypothetical protein